MKFLLSSAALLSYALLFKLTLFRKPGRSIGLGCIAYLSMLAWHCVLAKSALSLSCMK